MLYNKARHLELFKRFQDLDSQEKSLSEEHPDENAELLEYNIIIIYNA